MAYRKNGFLLKLPFQNDKIRNFAHYRTPFIHPTVLFRKSVFNKINLYNPKYLVAQDLDLWIRALNQDIKMSNLQEPLLYYRANKVITRISFLRMKLETKSRFNYKTKSLGLNIMKAFAIIKLGLPFFIRKLGYKYLR